MGYSHNTGWNWPCVKIEITSYYKNLDPLELELLVKKILLKPQRLTSFKLVWKYCLKNQKVFHLKRKLYSWNRLFFQKPRTCQLCAKTSPNSFKFSHWWGWGRWMAMLNMHFGELLTWYWERALPLRDSI